jgi:hypothetical protein
LEILKRAKGAADGEVAAWNENPENVKEEALKRSAKAGYCERDGTPKGAGKGDRYRPVNRQRYELNYERIFGK